MEFQTNMGWIFISICVTNIIVNMISITKTVIFSLIDQIS